ncbi:MAG: YceH family protein [Pseudomonadota bacterium]
MSTQDTEQHPENNIPDSKPMLTTIEARILGALMEKQLTTPDAYPLTLNSLVLACNQKTSREPTSNYEPGEVQRCLSAMQDLKWVEVDYGSRAARYGQRITRVLGVDKATQALLNVMLLRGPQTLAELLTRTQRMFEFANLQAVEEKMEQLCAKTTPVVVHIPRMLGQREDRYMHLLCGKPDLTAIAAMTNSTKSSSPVEDDRIPALEQKIENLEGQVKRLQQQVKVLMELNGVSEADIE